MEVLNEINILSILLGGILVIAILVFLLYAITVSRNKNSFDKPKHIQSLCVEAWARGMIHPGKILNYREHTGINYTDWDLGYGTFRRNVKNNRFKRITVGTALYVPGTWGRTFVCVVIRVSDTFEEDVNNFRSIMIGEAEYA